MRGMLNLAKLSFLLRQAFIITDFQHQTQNVQTEMRVEFLGRCTRIFNRVMQKRGNNRADIAHMANSP